MRTVSLKLLLLLLLGLRHHAESGSIVKFLPGLEGPLPFELETGYIGIGEEEELQSFYYFIKSEKNPEEDPLLIWISGGPGCSSISALLFENGPVTIKLEVYNGSLPSLVSTTYSWTKMANILFLDQPIGVGFSYKKTPNLDKSSDTIEVLRIYEFLQKWLGEHPEFSSNTFYVGGDSYSGKIVPAIVDKISQENYLCCKPPINLQGYVLGNPISNFESHFNYRIPYAHGMALISDELYKSLKRNCKGRYKIVDPSNRKCLKLVEEYHKCTDKIFRELILLPQCDEGSPLCWGYHSTLATYWANNERVREALQIRKGSIGKWIRCNTNIHYDDDIISSIPYHMNNSINGYRSLIYSGDHDMEVPFLATEAWIRSLNYPIIDDWRPWIINNQIAG
ncbi:Peptidase S10 serine carboxypeptidase [Arabidopsis suecica]|uniref:Peptidase S10 serine carboxypeptidase n=1 Tax=Arabidopsis suecica TaxID=45249 RepID=A0A8T2AI59_ARASU|nr:Peptidase S10 serine carboxypeptidase [Arabidopsis suecica]